MCKEIPTVCDKTSVTFPAIEVCSAILFALFSLTTVAILLQDRLYFEGGVYTFRGGDIPLAGDLINIFEREVPSIDSRPEKQLFWLDLRDDFSAETVISADSLKSVSVEGSQWHGSGAFFTDAKNTMMYSFGGMTMKNTDLLDSVESFNTTSLTWAKVSVSGRAFNGFQGDLRSSATTSTSGLGLNFVTRGFDTVQQPPGLLRFDASDPKDLKWRDETEGVPSLIGATMQYARFGPKGVLIAVGGYISVRSY